MTKIIVTHIYPPIPDRGYDWHATTDNYDGAPDAGPQFEGWGPTKREALNNLLQDFMDNSVGSENDDTIALIGQMLVEEQR